MGKSLSKAMGQVDRHGHERRGFLARESKHQTLVAGPLFLEEPLSIHSDSNVRTLLVDRRQHGACLPVKTH